MLITCGYKICIVHLSLIVLTQEVELYAKQTQTEVSLKDDGSESDSEEGETDNEPVRPAPSTQNKDKEEQDKPVSVSGMVPCRERGGDLNGRLVDVYTLHRERMG